MIDTDEEFDEEFNSLIELLKRERGQVIDED